MWPLPPLWLAICLAAALAVVSAASGGIGYRLGKSAGDREVLKMLKAGQAVVAKRDEAIKVNLEKAREDLAAANARRPKRVFLCPDDDLPKAPGGAPGAGATVVNRHDYGYDLRAARDALIRCNALIGVVK